MQRRCSRRRSTLCGHELVLRNIDELVKIVKKAANMDGTWWLLNKSLAAQENEVRTSMTATWKQEKSIEWPTLSHKFQTFLEAPVTTAQRLYFILRVLARSPVHNYFSRDSFFSKLLANISINRCPSAALAGCVVKGFATTLSPPPPLPEFIPFGSFSSFRTCFLHTL